MTVVVFAADPIPPPGFIPAPGGSDADRLRRDQERREQFERDRQRRLAEIDRQRPGIERANNDLTRKRDEAKSKLTASQSITNTFFTPAKIAADAAEAFPDRPQPLIGLKNKAAREFATLDPAAKFIPGTPEAPITRKAGEEFTSQVESGYGAVNSAVTAAIGAGDRMLLPNRELDALNFKAQQTLYLAGRSAVGTQVTTDKLFKDGDAVISVIDAHRILAYERGKDEPTASYAPRGFVTASLATSLVTSLRLMIQLANAAPDPHGDPNYRVVEGSRVLKIEAGFFREALEATAATGPLVVQFHKGRKAVFDKEFDQQEKLASDISKFEGDIAKNQSKLDDLNKQADDIKAQAPPKSSPSNPNKDNKGAGDQAKNDDAKNDKGAGGGAPGGGGGDGKGNAAKIEPAKIDGLGQLPQLQVPQPIQDVQIDQSRFAFVGGKDGSVLPGEVGVQGYKTGSIGSPFRTGRTPASQFGFDRQGKTPNLSNLVSSNGTPGSPIAGNSGAGAAAAVPPGGSGGPGPSLATANAAPSAGPGFDGSALNLPNEPGEYRAKNDFVRPVEFGGGGDGGGGGGGQENDSIVAKAGGGVSGGGGGEIVIGRGANQIKTARRLRNKSALGLMGYVGAFGELCSKELSGKATDVCGKAGSFRPIDGIAAAKPVTDSSGTEAAVVTRGPAATERKLLKPSEAKPTL